MTARFDHVSVVVKLAMKRGVYRRKMVALQVIIDVNLPIALDDVFASLDLAELSIDQGTHPRADLAKLSGQRRNLLREAHEHQRSPFGNAKLYQTDGARRKPTDTVHFRRFQQTAVEPVSPAVVAARSEE